MAMQNESQAKPTGQNKFAAAVDLFHQIPYAADILSPEVKGEGGDFSSVADSSSSVIIRIEIATTPEVKTIQFISYILTLLSIASTVILIVVKYERDPSIYLRTDASYFRSFVAIIAVFLFFLLLIGIIFVRRLLHAKRFGLVWSKRRRLISFSAFTLLIMQIACLSCMLADGIYSLTGVCHWQDKPVVILGYLQWTFYNTTFLLLCVLAHNGSLWSGKMAKVKKKDGGGGGQIDNPKQQNDDVEKASPPAQHIALVMDAKWTIHLPKMIIWFIFQAAITIVVAKFKFHANENNCTDFSVPLTCVNPSAAEIPGVVIQIVIIWVYFIIYLYFAWKTDSDIKSRPYAEMRLARMVFGVQRHQVLPVFLSFALCSTLFLTVYHSSCWTIVQMWLGVLPLAAMGTMMALTLSFYFMPKRPENAEEILQSWLQEFAWTKKSMANAIALRNAKLANSKNLARQPMFCVETAIKLLYFSKLVYHIRQDEVESTVLDINTKEIRMEPLRDAALGIDLTTSLAKTALSKLDDTQMDVQAMDQQEEMRNVGVNVTYALSLYHLNHVQVIFDPETDTKALIAWSSAEPATIVVAFKGTSSFKNAMTDINFLKVIHPPRRTAPLMSSLGIIQVPVRVHRGFQEAWTSNRYNEKILSIVSDIINQHSGPEHICVYVTGHSLGGALASLAAHAIKTAHPQLDVTVYTFGQPRVGNSAFAHEYNELIPHHFSIISDQDPVVRIPKGWYKRCGQRVFLDASGDIIVRPTYLEMGLITQTPRIKDHQTKMYRNGLLKLIKNQFLPGSHRSLVGGREGARELASDIELDRALLAVNVKPNDLENPKLEAILLEDYQHNTKT